MKLGKKTGVAGVVGVATASVLTAALNIATPTVKQNEGKRNMAYKDIFGNVTICYGETQNVHLGDIKSDAECDKQLDSRLYKDYELPVVRSLTRPINSNQLAAFTDFAYMDGVGTFRKSSMRRDFNAGRLEQACNDLLKYDRKVKALHDRHKRQRIRCLTPVK